MKRGVVIVVGAILAAEVGQAPFALAEEVLPPITGKAEKSADETAKIKKSDERAERVKDVFRVRYREKGVFECVPIAGAEECLRALCEAGITLAVATSKPDVFAKQILERHGFTRYFATISGAETDAQKKSDVVRKALNALSLFEGIDNCVMVGDRKYDVEGAAACGIPCIGLNTGFAEEGEFERAGAIEVVANYSELTRILLA